MLQMPKILHNLSLFTLFCNFLVKPRGKRQPTRTLTMAMLLIVLYLSLSRYTRRILKLCLDHSFFGNGCYAVRRIVERLLIDLNL